MGKKKSKSSRKGKKEWRANISSQDMDDFIEKSTKDALSGGSLSHLPNDSLFFLDTSKDLSVKRKIEKHREKVLRCDSLLQRNPFVRAVPSSSLKKSKTKKHKKLPHPKDASEDAPVSDHSGLVDLWENEGECDKKTTKISKPSVIPAVEVEPPGCSFNPSFEAHQDSLAQAVAEEMHKVYQNELGPQTVPLMVPGKPIDEEDMYFLEADNGTDDDVNEENQEDDTAYEKRPKKEKRVNRVELNRRARLKGQQRKEAEAKKKEEVSKEIDCLPNIIQEIAKEDEEKSRKQIRRVVVKNEKLKARPPRLGKHKYACFM
uniref:Ribosome biogenesis protein NOP53 n=1 Tax=Rhizophora mucronata TaxID=61149 RepID=A0A2P2L0C0_RHIMU